MNAAHNTVKNNATFKACYDKKTVECRSHYNALGHCADKLVRVIWKMMTMWTLTSTKRSDINM